MSLIVSHAMPFFLLFTLPPGSAPIIFISFLIGLFIFLIQYIIYKIFPTPTGEAYINNEIAEQFRTLIILGVFLSIGVILSNLSAALINYALSGYGYDIQHLLSSNYDGHVKLAFYSLETMTKQLEGMYVSYFALEFFIGFVSTLSFPIGSTAVIGPSATAFVLFPYAGLDLLASLHTTIIDYVLYILIFLYAKLYILLFSWKVVPSLLFPLGIALRAFPLTRKTGSTILGICIALYFAFPMTVLFSNYLVYDVYKPTIYTYSPSKLGFSSNEGGDVLSTLTKELSKKYKERADDLRNRPEDLETKLMSNAEEDVKGNSQSWIDEIPILSSIWHFVKGVYTNFIKPIISSIKIGIETIIATLSFPLFLKSALYAATPVGMLDAVYDIIVTEVVNVSQYAILLFITSILEIIITVSIYSGISEFLGGELKILGISKVV